MLLHWRQDTKISLYTLGVVVAYVGLDHLNKLVFAGKASAVIALSFQNTPEALHWAVVNAVSHSGHALCHTGSLQFVMECSVRILKSAVTMK